MASSFFVSDLHGKTLRYQKLFEAISSEKPEAVFIGGDLMPRFWAVEDSLDFPPRDFIVRFLAKNFQRLRTELRASYPRVFVILGNDDSRLEEVSLLGGAGQGLWEYVSSRKAVFKEFSVYGYAYVPPTPFRFKDWERYDVSRFVDPGSVSPEEGFRSVPVSEREKKYLTIKADLERLVGDDDLERAIFLFHAPPYKTKLDISHLENKMIDHVPLDRHLGSIAIRRFIEARQPLLTLHGHVHEAARLSGSWRDRIGRTHCFSAAYDGPELALVRFDPNRLDAASRELI
jgi:Icc-related predicted phosphoesterase